MSALPGLLRNRWVLGGLAVAALAVIIWTVGDVLVLGGWRPLETIAGRAVLVALVVAAWIGWEVVRGRRLRRENERMLEVIAGGADESDSATRAAHEVAVLRQRFEEATGKLKRARFKGPDGEPRYVHELPWYVIIGAPGSGKTTALVNSGLHFPLPGAGGVPSVTGVGGTRNCDWWFTEEAVMLDTAGRYTTQESDSMADASAWLGFLDLLKRFRPSLPLNGAIVTLSISDLVLWGPEERARYAAHVRARVLELYARLGTRFPVYLLVTKADLLAGFMEFFGELDSQARARVWGTTFEYAGGARPAADPKTRFALEFAELERRLQAEMIERLQQEDDLQRRAAMYRFPQEFHGTGALIEQFLDSVFGGVEEAAAMLRGVYFTSGTQEGSPIDRVLGTLSRSFNLERAAASTPALAGTGKSFFLTRLLREVIFPESGLAARDEKLEARQRKLQIAAFAAIGAVTASLLALWCVSYLGNASFIASAQAKAAGAGAALKPLATPAPGQEGQMLKALSALRELPGGYGDQKRDEVPAPGFGLSQAEKLGGQAVRAYRNALRDALLPAAARALEGEVREGLRSPKPREGLAEAMAAYLSLYDSKTPDPRLLEPALRRAWNVPDAGRAELASHFQAAVEGGATEVRHPRDEAIIKDARQRMATGKSS
jgi:type VI secretion system protein ImpL